MSKLDRTDRFLLFILFAVTVSLYARTASFGFIDFDDNQYVYDNPHLKLGLSVDGIGWAITTGYFSYWHPVTWLTYLATSSIFGIRAGPMHLVNFVLHACNACMLFYFLKRTTGNRWPAAIAAALWAWHPLRVESVAWVSETKDMLSCFFCLLTLIAYARYTRSPDFKRYLLVSVAILLALASKPTVVTLPAVLLLMDYWPLHRLGAWRWAWRLVVEKIPWLLMVLVVALLAYHVQGANHALELTLSVPLADRLKNAAVSSVAYLFKSIWPIHLAVFYPHPSLIGRAIPVWQWAGSLMILIGITIWTTLQRRTSPFLWIGWLWFLGTLVPMIGIIQAGEQAMADRYSLIPSIGLTMAVVWLVTSWVSTWSLRITSTGSEAPVIRPTLVTAIALLLCAGFAISWRQIGYWRDTQTLFSHADSVVPDNYLARSILANDLLNSGKDIDRAVALLRSAVELCPNLTLLRQVYACALEKHGENQQALKQYLIAINRDPASPTLRNDLAALLITMGRDQDALKQFRAAVRLDRDMADARNNLAVLLARSGKLDEAIGQWQEAVRLKPDQGVYHGLLADGLRVRGDRAQAMKQYAAAIAAGEHRPDWEAALAWFVATDPNSSSAQVQNILPIAQDACEQTNRQDLLSLDTLAAALARLGRFDEAASIAATAADRADAENHPTLAADIRARMHRYQSGQPYIVQLGSSQQ